MADDHRSDRSRSSRGRETRESESGTSPTGWRAHVRSPGLWGIALLFVAAAAAGLSFGSWQNLCATCPSVAEIRTWEPVQTSKLLTHDGHLIVEIGEQRRTPVSIETLPAHLPQAVIAIEDRRFYEHGGFDLRGFGRAVVGQLTGRNMGGGSTLTQQLARNMFQEEIGFARRYTRKLKELQVAFELERSYSKDQILEAYLNQIYLGRGHGVQQASQGYFGKEATELNVAESALLAAVLNRPGAYNPFTSPERALARRNLVLEQMADVGYLTEQEAERWKDWPLPDQDRGVGGVYGPAPYFEEWVRQILDSRFGQQVYTGGLRVYTTLDLGIQAAAEEAMEWGWERVEEQPNFRHPAFADFDSVTSFPGETPYLQGTLVALDPATGGVRALVGGRDYEQSKFDRARLAERQAGSSFKPFVYAAAIQSGIPASHIVEDQPVVYEQVDGTEWRPRNYGGEFLGPMTIRRGLRESRNMIAIRLGWEDVGIESVAQLAQRMGIQTEIERYPSTTIGAVEVVPLQMAEAYSTFANLGVRARAHPILRVENADGEILWEPQPERTQVMDSLAARIVVDMLQDAANRGTGANLRSIGELPYAVPAAGKTGTTNDGTDTWFVGFTPNLVAAVWMGMDRPQPLARGAPQATGGFYTSPVWGRFMRYVYYGLPEEAVGEAARLASLRAPAEPVEGLEDGALPIPSAWPIPVGLTTRPIDARTGLLWSEWCENPEENRYTELFLPGTEPTEYCDDTRRERFRMPRLPGGLDGVRPPRIDPADTIRIRGGRGGGNGGGGAPAAEGAR